MLKATRSMHRCGRLNSASSITSNVTGCGLVLFQAYVWGAGTQALPAGVEDLGLALNEVSSEGAADLAPALRGLRRLRRLSLRENELGNEGAASIASALAATSTLEMLDLTQNQVSSCCLAKWFPHLLAA